MQILARLIFAVLQFRARRGFIEPLAGESLKQRSRRTGIHGETYAYWYLRRHGYTMIARNFTVAYLNGEIDLVGYDGNTLAFIEVKTRDASAPGAVRPEDAVDSRKRSQISRMAAAFVRSRRINPASLSIRFDILAIESHPSVRPTVRLQKGAFTAPHF